ncbi:MAG: aconitate hydratase [Planctomycetota bacterium]|nr:MAG: aconitate hydratase [Planctomycetota bacterium]
MSTNSLIPITHFLLDSKNNEQVLFDSEKKDLTLSRLKSEVSILMKKINLSKNNKWVLNAENKFSFLVGFLALLHCHKSIVLPPGPQKGILNELERQVDAYLLGSEFDSSKEVLVINDQVKIDGINDTESFNLIDSKNISITFFTSGSTGNPKKIKKTLNNLIEEVNVLEDIWGAKIDKSVITSTVSHQHIYGLLFSLLWPLATERLMSLELFQYPEILFEKIKAYDQVCLISSPAQLSRMPSLVELKNQSSKKLKIFSSGGPLSFDTVNVFEDDMGEAPIEVFGSSETGGIAWRQRIKDSPDSQTWKPLNGVRISINKENVLLVDSPFINEERIDGWYQTNDLIKLKRNHCFQLLGRNDRIVKIEEKRLSLAEMEKRLLKHAFIVDVAVLEILNGGASNGKSRTQLGAVLQLNDIGNKFLSENGRLKLANNIKDYLLGHFERILLPRKWRYVEFVPQNQQGKRILAELQHLFKERDLDRNLFPDLLEENLDEDKVLLKIKVPSDLYYLKGHFENLPVVPGVVQINWVMQYAEKYFKVEPNIKSMENIKFFNILQKEGECDISIEYKNKRLFYEYSNASRKFSSGRITLL